MTSRLLTFRTAIVEEINSYVCPACGLTTANIKDDEFSCRGDTSNHIVYRAMIVGTEVYSAPHLVSLIQSWVASGIASITVLSTRLHLDKDCNTYLDSFIEPDCPLEFVATSAGIPVTTFAMENKEPVVDQVNIRAGEIGGFIIGVIIIILLAVLILVIAAITIKKMNSKRTKE